ncbi:MAG: DHH family phosphoesterase [Lachnospiraceae bacterium]|nr:DHH family phosphoesterase [Candidatus Merdinaster equi]
MTLKDLLCYKDIVIQCHDNPDADALASGFALHSFFTKHKINAKFIYGGKMEIRKSNLKLMVEQLEIPVEYVTSMDEPELLVTVDCQYDGGNVTHFDAKTVAVIDHHQITGDLPELSVVRSNIGSCSTVVWDLLRNEGIDVNEDSNLATALYYGLLTDTNNFTELWHPLDKDMRYMIDYSRRLITTFRNSNLTMEELHIAGEALKKAIYLDEHSCGYVESEPCDPNILGIISDMMLEVEGVNCCLVYSILPFGVKISVRSCVKEVKASEFAEYIASGVGNGGGHLEKAGGFLERKLLEKEGIAFETTSIEAFMKGRLSKYFEDTEIIYAGKYDGNLSQYGLYQKLPVKLGYVDSSLIELKGQGLGRGDAENAGGLQAGGATALLRTLEGDIDVKLGDGVYIMLGIGGEIYPTKKEKFERNYECLDEPYSFPGEYPPVVKNMEEGVNVEILKYAKSCVSKECSRVYGVMLDHRVKVFTSWDEEKYYLGKPGDYLVAREEDPDDVYIIAGDIFAITYESVEK